MGRSDGDQSNSLHTVRRGSGFVSPADSLPTAPPKSSKSSRRETLGGHLPASRTKQARPHAAPPGLLLPVVATPEIGLGASPKLSSSRRKRKDLWAAGKKEMVAAVKKKKAGENRKVIFARAKQYGEEYDAQDKELMQLNFGIRSIQINVFSVVPQF